MLTPDWVESMLCIFLPSRGTLTSEGFHVFLHYDCFTSKLLALWWSLRFLPSLLRFVPTHCHWVFEVELSQALTWNSNSYLLGWLPTRPAQVTTPYFPSNVSFEANVACDSFFSFSQADRLSIHPCHPRHCPSLDVSSCENQHILHSIQFVIESCLFKFILKTFWQFFGWFHQILSLQKCKEMHITVFGVTCVGFLVFLAK